MKEAGKVEETQIEACPLKSQPPWFQTVVTTLECWPKFSTPSKKRQESRCQCFISWFFNVAINLISIGWFRQNTFLSLFSMWASKTPQWNQHVTPGWVPLTSQTSGSCWFKFQKPLVVNECLRCSAESREAFENLLQGKICISQAWI